jgi:hypothetical protein
LFQIVEDNAEEVTEDSEAEIIKSDVGKSLPIIPNILISIDEIDEKGNLIKRQIVETQETNELPPSEEPPLILL